MRISSRLSLTSSIALGVLGIMILVVLWTFQEIKNTHRNELLIIDMGKAFYEQSVLRDDYLLRQEDRARIQWRAKGEQIRKLLEQAEKQFSDIHEKGILDEIREKFTLDIFLFSSLTEYFNNTENIEKLFFSMETQRMLSQIIANDYNLASATKKLQESVKKRADAAQEQTTTIMIATMIFVVLLTVGNSLSISRTLIKRIVVLTEGAQIIGSGNLEHQISVKGNDELSDLGRLSNAMAKNLSKSLISVKNLQREIRLRKQGEEEIRLLNLELEQRVIDRTIQLEAANKELKAFSYSVSHDLRGPLRGIDGFSQALLEDYGNKLDDTGKNYLERVCKATQHMGWLIDDMLKLSRVSQAEFHREAVDLSLMVRAIAENYQEQNADRAVDVTVQEGIIVQGDHYLIKIAIENLVGNAFKFTGKEAHPRIAFGMTVSDGKTAYFIRDNGAGFDMTYVGKLFGAFQRLHTADDFPGTGIGLATVQRIIHRHGGQIWAEGETGKGATFYFTVPSVQAGAVSL